MTCALAIASRAISEAEMWCAMALLFGKDRRVNRRQPVRVMAASLSTLENRSLGDCVIRDISADGARLELNEKRTLPKFIYIFDVREQRDKCAEVVRQDAQNVGIRFVASPTEPQY
jgi:hypothetical protein